jgi:hypothetical protein
MSPKTVLAAASVWKPNMLDQSNPDREISH